MIEVTCPLDGEVYYADAAHVGKRIKCTKCGSLLSIIDGTGTIVQRPPRANAVRPSRPAIERGAVRHKSRKVSFGLGIVGLAVVAAGLLIRRGRTNTSTDIGIRDHDGVSQTHSLVESATGRPSANADGSQVVGDVSPVSESDGLPCNDEDSANRRSMPNGRLITSNVGGDGYGVLEVQNGTAEDAVLSLYDSTNDTRVREVYVRASSSVQMKGIPKGTYELAYTHGIDWVSDDIFRCGDRDYAQFERQFAFTEEKDREGIRYNTITVTLHP